MKEIDDAKLHIISSVAKEAMNKLNDAGQFMFALITVDASGMPYVFKDAKVDTQSFRDILEYLMESIDLGKAQKVEEPKVN